MPSGRDPHTPKEFVIPALSEGSLINMRAPPDPSETFKGDEDDSADEDEQVPPIGAFPSTPSTNYY